MNVPQRVNPDAGLPALGGDARRDHYSASVVLLVFLAAVLVGVGIVSSIDYWKASAEPAQAEFAVDPNTAPWWELTAVPRIGPATAMKIVDARRRLADGGHPVFKSAGDLDVVRGIGPVTVQRIAPYLRFGVDRP